MFLRAAVMTLLCVAAPASGQEAATGTPALPQDPGRIGLGLNLGPILGLSFSIPIRVGSGWRLEPELGARNATVDAGPGAWRGTA